MTDYRLTPQAVEDLLEIWSYIAEDSVAAADRVQFVVLDACEHLARSPLMGTIRADLTPLPVRFWWMPSFRNYFLVYDANSQPLRIIRILHGSRNLRSILG